MFTRTGPKVCMGGDAFESAGPQSQTASRDYRCGSRNKSTKVGVTIKPARLGCVS